MSSAVDVAIVVEKTFQNAVGHQLQFLGQGGGGGGERGHELL